MSHVEPDEQEEKPLDPAMERVRRKMIRLQLVSAGVMFISLMAVLGAVVYKATRPAKPQAGVPAIAAGVPSGETITRTIALPDGLTIENTSLSGTQILVFGRLADGTRKAFVADIASGQILADLTLAGN